MAVRQRLAYWLHCWSERIYDSRCREIVRLVDENQTEIFRVEIIADPYGGGVDSTYESREAFGRYGLRWDWECQSPPFGKARTGVKTALRSRLKWAYRRGEAQWGRPDDAG